MVLGPGDHIYTAYTAQELSGQLAQTGYKLTAFQTTSGPFKSVVKISMGLNFGIVELESSTGIRFIGERNTAVISFATNHKGRGYWKNVETSFPSVGGFGLKDTVANFRICHSSGFRAFFIPRAPLLELKTQFPKAFQVMDSTNVARINPATHKALERNIQLIIAAEVKDGLRLETRQQILNKLPLVYEQALQMLEDVKNWQALAPHSANELSVARAIPEITARIDRGSAIDTKDMGKICGLGEKALSVACKGMFELTPGNVLNRFKRERALVWMKHPEIREERGIVHTLEGIADRLGWSASAAYRNISDLIGDEPSQGFVK